MESAELRAVLNLPIGLPQPGRPPVRLWSRAGTAFKRAMGLEPTTLSLGSARQCTDKRSPLNPVW